MDERENNAYNSLDSPKEKEDTLFGDLKSAIGIKGLKMEKKSMPKRRIISAIGLLIAIILCAALPFFMEPRPPAPDVVASYNGKNISAEDLKSFLEVEGVREAGHYICDKHGYDHSRCTPDEECEKHPIDSLEGYRSTVTIMAVEQIIQDWAKEKGLTQKEEVQHGISDLLDSANAEGVLDKISAQEFSPDSISKLDVQLYFDENKKKYEGKTLAEAEEEIRQILLEKKAEEYFPKYIEELKKTAGLQVDYELLKVKKPSDGENADFNEKREYEARRNDELFNVRGKKYTLDDFYREFLELPAEYQEKFSDYEKKKMLVEQMIIKELLLEESTNAADTKKDSHNLEELKIEYLSQMLHQEEVDDKIEEVTEEEIKAFYENNQDSFSTSEKTLTYEEAKELIRKHLNYEKHYELTKAMEKKILEDSGFMIYDRTIKKMLKEQEGEQ